jgi:hypothetical protein
MASKRADEHIATLAREAEHRTKNILATVQATVNLSQSKTPDDLKRVIEGRIRALANVHTLFVETRWKGAELSTLARRELAPYVQTNEARAHITSLFAGDPAAVREHSGCMILSDIVLTACFMAGTIRACAPTASVRLVTGYWGIPKRL